ncbi:MAG: hypothetical protein QOH57_4274 [Mycobacterium sp.]|jgi:hypothetical protein|nr:hypothetical protein [Mycobacterium sp.]
MGVSGSDTSSRARKASGDNPTQDIETIGRAPSALGVPAAQRDWSDVKTNAMMRVVLGGALAMLMTYGIRQIVGNYL